MWKNDTLDTEYVTRWPIPPQTVGAAKGGAKQAAPGQSNQAAPPHSILYHAYIEPALPNERGRLQVSDLAPQVCLLYPRMQLPQFPASLLVNSAASAAKRRDEVETWSARRCGKEGSIGLLRQRRGLRVLSGDAPQAEPQAAATSSNGDLAAAAVSPRSSGKGPLRSSNCQQYQQQPQQQQTGIVTKSPTDPQLHLQAPGCECEESTVTWPRGPRRSATSPGFAVPCPLHLATHGKCGKWQLIGRAGNTNPRTGNFRRPRQHESSTFNHLEYPR